MKPTYRCAKTGVLYPPELVDRWGQDGIGDGYGPTPVSFHLRPTGRKLDGQDVYEAVRAPLAALMVADNAEDDTTAAETFSRGFTHPRSGPRAGRPNA